jgi:hypothetical protein
MQFFTLSCDHKNAYKALSCLEGRDSIWCKLTLCFWNLKFKLYYIFKGAIILSSISFVFHSVFYQGSRTIKMQVSLFNLVLFVNLVILQIKYISIKFHIYILCTNWTKWDGLCKIHRPQTIQVELGFKLSIIRTTMLKLKPSSHGIMLFDVFEQTYMYMLFIRNGIKVE